LLKTFLKERGATAGRRGGDGELKAAAAGRRAKPVEVEGRDRLHEPEGFF